MIQATTPNRKPKPKTDDHARQCAVYGNTEEASISDIWQGAAVGRMLGSLMG
jgi:hypothetical protein